DGKFIAGTGTITGEGKVGSIGGITHKMLAAKEPGATPSAVLDAIRLSTVRTAQSSLHGVDFKFNGDLFELPAGPVGFAAGIEARTESLVSRN
ncbi:hypothetical protein, partial [Acinetobacter variabilis]|uniref:hypothetical protein n=1 Tax=Acinetobacter variabilis TaxID=70346 RepID=UPI0030FB0583